MSYFQLQYFQNNVVQATAEAKTMFNPKCDFFVPQFPLLPEKSLDDITRSKIAFVLLYQNSAVEGAQFTRELLLIRIIKDIRNFVNETSCKDVNTADAIKHIFSLGYMRAKIEFNLQYKIKNIDWGKREDKVRHTIPFWRKQTIKIPPTKPFNKYSVALAENIKTSKISFKSEELKDEYTKFFQNSEAVVKRMKTMTSLHSSPGIGYVMHPPAGPSNSNSHGQQQHQGRKLIYRGHRGQNQFRRTTEQKQQQNSARPMPRQNWLPNKFRDKEHTRQNDEAQNTRRRVYEVNSRKD